VCTVKFVKLVSNLAESVLESLERPARRAYELSGPLSDWVRPAKGPLKLKAEREKRRPGDQEGGAHQHGRALYKCTSRASRLPSNCAARPALERAAAFSRCFQPARVTPPNTGWTERVRL
jgi:hypothetical protein